MTLPDPALVQVEAGNRALKAVFGGKLAAKGKSLAELLQPHSIGKLFGCLVLLHLQSLTRILKAQPVNINICFMYNMKRLKFEIKNFKLIQ